MHTHIPKIHCRDGINATIQEHLKSLKIDAEWLTAKGSCDEGRLALLARFPEGATYPEVRAWIAEIGRADWEHWVLTRVGGDTATAGHRGTATAGDYGTATAGDYGTATAGHGGTATAGDYGTATAGHGGTATAGHGGALTILFYDPTTNRYRRVAASVGEGSLKPNTPYKLDDKGQFIEA